LALSIPLQKFVSECFWKCWIPNGWIIFLVFARLRLYTLTIINDNNHINTKVNISGWVVGCKDGCLNSCCMYYLPLSIKKERLLDQNVWVMKKKEYHNKWLLCLKISLSRLTHRSQLTRCKTLTELKKRICHSDTSLVSLWVRLES
jgi:hypothetical protein